MRHRKRRGTLGRTAPQRRALVRHLVRGLVQHDRIETTFPRAKAAQRVADSLVTLGKNGSVAAQRRAAIVLGRRRLVQRLVAEVAPRFSERQGGYTRVVRLGDRRMGDGAELAVLEWTVRPQLAPKPERARRGKARATEPQEAAGQHEDVDSSTTGAPETSETETAEQQTTPERQEKDRGFLGGLRKLLRRRERDRDRES